METGNGKCMETENGNSQNLMQMNSRVKPLNNDHLLKTTSVQRPPLHVQRPHKNNVPKITDDCNISLQRPPLCKDHLLTKTSFTYF